MKILSTKTIYDRYCSATSTFLRQDNVNLSFITALMPMAHMFSDFQWWHSGGGCCHLLAQLHDGRILILHTADDYLEVTYETYHSIVQYLDIDEDGKGMGWEYVQPDHDKRSTTLREDMSLMNIEKAIDRVLLNKA